MTKGPKSEKRPADINARALMIAKFATGKGKVTADGKNAAAVALGRMGGRARASSLTKKQRSEIARKAAATRWKS
jgi:hypothetical protein